MLGGGIVVEGVFAIPGVGRLALEAVVQRDMPLLLGVMLISAATVVAVNLVDRPGLRHARSQGRQQRVSGMSILRAMIATGEGAVGLAVLAMSRLRCAGGAPAVPGRSAGDRGAGSAAAVHAIRPICSAPIALAGTCWSSWSTARAPRCWSRSHRPRPRWSSARWSGRSPAFFGGIVDEVLMRITEAFQTVPAFLLSLAFISVTGPAVPTIVLAIALGAWTQPARIARAEVLSLRERDFVAAARVIGMRPLEIALREILPNALTPVVSLAAVIVAAAVLIEAALSFLGLGDPNRVTWGSMIAEGRTVLRSAPFLSIVPGLALVVTVLAVHLDGARPAGGDRRPEGRGMSPPLLSVRGFGVDLSRRRAPCRRASGDRFRSRARPPARPDRRERLRQVDARAWRSRACCRRMPRPPARSLSRRSARRRAPGAISASSSRIPRAASIRC